MRIPRFHFRSRLAIPAALLALAFVWTYGHRPVLAQFFNPQPDPPGFGIFGIVQGETARIHVLCNDHSIGGHPPDPCSVQLQFKNSANAILKSATLSLQPGQYGRLDLPSTDLKWNPGQLRWEVRPNVEFESGHVLVTAQSFDTATGFGHLFINAAVPRLSLLVQ